MKAFERTGRVGGQSLPTVAQAAKTGKNMDFDHVFSQQPKPVGGLELLSNWLIPDGHGLDAFFVGP